VPGPLAVNTTRCVGRRRCTRGQRSQIDIAKCCAAAKFRSTVDFGSFPFRYLTRTGASRQGEELSGIRCVAEIACPFAELRWTAPSPGTSRVKAEVGNHRISLTSGLRESRGLKRSNGVRFHTA
jgi:hypothetical protein